MEVLAGRVSRSFGVPVSYEDPPWSFTDDLVPWTSLPEYAGRSEEVKARIDPKLRAPVPASIEIELQLRRKAETGFDLARLVLQSALADHQRRNNPGRFQLVNVGNVGLSIVPTAVRNAKGKDLPVVSPLDARISFPLAKRSFKDTLRVIGDAVSAASGQKLVVETYPLGNFPEPYFGSTQLEARSEIAREVIARAFRDVEYRNEDTPLQYWWNLHFNLNDGYRGKKGTYSIEIYRVTRDLYDSGQGIVHGDRTKQQQRDVYWPPKSQK